MAIKVKLPRTIKGKELADVVEASMKELDTYNLSKHSILGYELGSVHETEVSRNLSVKKALRGEYLLALIPLAGWPSLKLMTYNGKARFSTKIDIDEEYADLDIDVTRHETYSATSSDEPTFKEKLKPDFDKLVQGIYSRLQTQAA